MSMLISAALTGLGSLGMAGTVTIGKRAKTRLHAQFDTLYATLGEMVRQSSRSAAKELFKNQIPATAGRLVAIFAVQAPTTDDAPLTNQGILKAETSLSHQANDARVITEAPGKTSGLPSQTISGVEGVTAVGSIPAVVIGLERKHINPITGYLAQRATSFQLHGMKDYQVQLEIAVDVLLEGAQKLNQNTPFAGSQDDQIITAAQLIRQELAAVNRAQRALILSMSLGVSVCIGMIAIGLGSLFVD